MADGLPVPTTTKRWALIPSGARISSTEPLLPLNWLVAAARLTVSAAFPSALRRRSAQLQRRRRKIPPRHRGRPRKMGQSRP